MRRTSKTVTCFNHLAPCQKILFRLFIQLTKNKQKTKLFHQEILVPSPLLILN